MLLIDIDEFGSISSITLSKTSTLREPKMQHKQGVNLCYGGYFETRKNFTIPLFWGFQ